MLVVTVQVAVKPEHRDAFLAATRENAGASLGEPGVLRFDVLARADDPSRFLLYEAYRDEAAAAAHKTTPHYARWRDAVAPWMAEPRQGVRHAAVFPEAESAWKARA